MNGVDLNLAASPEPLDKAQRIPVPAKVPAAKTPAPAPAATPAPAAPAANPQPALLNYLLGSGG
jgi:hypothetical protein